MIRYCAVRLSNQPGQGGRTLSSWSGLRILEKDSVVECV